MLLSREKGLEVDVEAFEKEMEAQKKRSQKQEVEGLSKLVTHAKHLEKTFYLGSEEKENETMCDGKILGIFKDGEMVEGLKKNEEAWVLFDQTIFYAESGGQTSDGGCCVSASKKELFKNKKNDLSFDAILKNKTTPPSAKILDVQKKEGYFFHAILAMDENVTLGDTHLLVRDERKRESIRKNHSATHLLHKALRMKLGEHVRQAGSLVSEEKLRFDFNHFEPLSKDCIREIEKEVYEMILKNERVITKEMLKTEAEKLGAMAFFEEK